LSGLRRPLLALILAAAAFGLAACENTIRGVGRDVRATGRAIGDAVEGR
jgi:predicted small secreted protein